MKPKISIVEDPAVTNAAAQETISMRELRHERAVMFLPEDDPIPGFDTKGLVNQTLEAFRTGASEEDKIALMNQIAVIGDKMVMPCVLMALDDDNEEIRILAVETMKAIDDPAIVEGVEKALNDKSADLREEAIECLATLTPTSDLNEVLMTALKDEDEDVRANALDMLTMLVDDSTMPSLSYALTEGDVDAQETALALLEQLNTEGNSEALGAIIEGGMLSKHRSVREMATDILKSATGENFSTYEQWAAWNAEKNKGK